MATINSVISLTDNMSSKLTTIKGGVDGIVTSMENIQKTADGVSWNTFLDNAQKAGKKMTEIGKTMTLAISTPLLLLGKKAYNGATDYESAFTGVKKTVDATEAEYETLRQNLLKKSETMPVGFIQLSGIEEAAGQSGVVYDNLGKFTETYAKLQTATDIQGTDGVLQVAQMLNLTEKGTENIDRYGASIVALGNNFSTTESMIQEMAYRMAATGSLTGFTTPQILGLSAAFTSLGINAEAGGSAASKLMKQMQLSSEVGVPDWQKLMSGAQSYFEGKTFNNIHDVQMAIDGLSKSDLTGFASSLGYTTDELDKAVGAASDMEYFSKISGKTAEQFQTDWAKNPAQTMLDFFSGLGSLDESGMQSAVSALDAMGITEIRLSNLIAASAYNPELVKNAIAMAEEAYAANTALDEEYNRFASTQASQNTMLKNKFDNSMADLGNNLVRALQPALDTVNDLLDTFNSLSEVDQDKIVALMGALVIAGPALTVMGSTVTAITGIAKGLEAIKKCEGVKNVLSSLSTFFLTTPVGQALAIAAAVGAIAIAIDAIPTKAEQVATALQNIPITLDQTTYNETMAAIDALQAKIDELKSNPEEMETMANTSEAVKMGYGTNTMYGNSLMYEAAMAEDEYSQIVNDYTGRIRDAESKIVNAQTDSERQTWLATVKQLESDMGVATDGAKQRYTQSISDLYNGMVKQYPEFAAKMKQASKQYDLLGTLQQVGNFEWESPDYGSMTWDQREAFDTQKQLDWNSLMKGMYGQAYDLGYMKDSGFTLDQIFSQVDSGNMNNAGWIMSLQDTVLGGLQESVQAISDNPAAYSLFQSILDNPALTENMDVTQLQGAMDGVMEALDFKTAMENAAAAGDANNFGAYLTQGLANGIIGSQGTATDAASAMGTATIDAEGAALGVNSPSVYAMEHGMNVAEGLGIGITSGTAFATAAVTALGATVIAAIAAVCNQSVATASSILSYGVGSGIGGNVTAGLAGGILAGKAAVVAAARAVAAAASAAMRVSWSIHSPSKVAYEYGQYYSEGLAGGILGGLSDVTQSIGKVTDSTAKQMNAGIWSMIDDYNELEFAQMQDENQEIKISDADLKKVRSLAEREIINQFTTAELHVEFTAQNNINSNLDLDEVVSYLEDKVSERLEVVAGGVYS